MSSADLRAVREERSVTIERRSASGEWEPIRIGELVALLKPGSWIWRWLEDHGVLWGAWVGRGKDEIASFSPRDGENPSAGSPPARPSRRGSALRGGQRAHGGGE